ncbi:MAG TPA: hypothetical protein VH482_05260, partial [Thermomicrobiales bacterium]
RMLQLADPVPAPAEAVPFSLPFVLALVLRRVPAGPEWIAPRTLADPDVLALARRVSIDADPKIDEVVDGTGRLPAEVCVRMDDGRLLRGTVADAPWGPDDSPDGRDLEAKFLGMAQPCLGDRARRFAASLRCPPAAGSLTARHIADLVA